MAPLSRPGSISGPVPGRVRSVMLGPGLPFAGPGPPLLARTVLPAGIHRWESRTQPTAFKSQHWPRWSRFELGRKPVPRAQAKKGSEVYGSNTTARCRCEITPFTCGHTKPKSSSHSRTHFGSVITQRPWTLPTSGPVVVTPRRPTPGIAANPKPRGRLGEHTQ